MNIIIEMPQHPENGAPRSIKKRYQTPLHLKDMLRVDGERREYLAEKMRQSSLRNINNSLLTYEPSSWIASGPCTENGDARPQLYSDIDEAAIRNDSWLPYERPVPNRNNDTYWRVELEHVNWDGVTLGGEDTPARETAASLARLRPPTTDLDDPFISPARPHAISQASDQYALLSPRPERPRSKKTHYRGRSLLSRHTFLENGQMYHPQLHAKRPESVPNYSRPLTPDCNPTPKRGTRSKNSTVNSRHSDRAISYERVNGIYLDTTPKSAKERREGLSIPEIEARDLVKLDEWLHEHIPAEAEFTSMEPHPARPPPPIGGKENSVRAISPQPPSAGKNHTFVSRYSWNVEIGTDEPPLPASAPTTVRSEQERQDANTSNQVEPARALLTEIIQGILGPAGTSTRPDGEIYSGENDAGQPLYAHHDYPPDYSTLQPHDRPDNLEETGITPRYAFEATTSSSRHYLDRSYRKKIGSYGRNAIKFMSLRSSRICGRCTF